MTALTVPDVGRLLFCAARVNIAVTAEDGSPVVDTSATIIAFDNPDGRLVLVAVTEAGREVRLPVDVEGIRAVAGAA